MIKNLSWITGGCRYSHAVDNRSLEMREFHRQLLNDRQRLPQTVDIAGHGSTRKEDCKSEASLAVYWGTVSNWKVFLKVL